MSILMRFVKLPKPMTWRLVWAMDFAQGAFKMPMMKLNLAN